MIPEIITQIQDIIYYVRVQNYHEGSLRFRSLLKDVEGSEKLYAQLQNQQSSFFAVFSQMLEALETSDMILVADLLEAGALPILNDMNAEPEEYFCGNYKVEGTVSGYKTIKHLPSGIYLHSNVNPMDEARVLIKQCYDMKKEKYAVWGCGLAYHILRLYEMTRGSIPITVFEEDEQIIELANKVGVLKKIPVENLACVLDKNGSKFAEFISDEKVGVLMHLPSIRKIEDFKVKQLLHSFFASWNGVIQYKEELANNFRYNNTNCRHNVDEIKQDLEGKDVVIVGAGPSLDSCGIDYMREVVGKKKIVAVTTVLKKLLACGITPDYTIVMDSQQRTIAQIEGGTDISVPIIIDSTACWRFAKEYKGCKYIVYQKGYEDAEKAANDGKFTLYETGGSVTTLALEIVLKSSAKTVELVGVDLAYPEGVSHASGTIDCEKRVVSGMEKVRAVDGTWVYTDILFNSYRIWIENKILEYPWVPVYNLSDCGAAIKGTERKIIKQSTGDVYKDL